MRAAGLVLCLVLLGAGCTSSPPADVDQEATHQTVSCPAEVEIAVVIPHECGELVVPEDRARPDGPAVQLAYLRVQPDEETEGEVPILSVGYELAQPPDYGDIVGITQSTGRELIVLSQRGSAPSEPRLDCPETERIGLLDPPASAAADRFADAVAECRERLVLDGIDPAAYTLDAAAHDVADLRAALRIAQWDLVSWGSASRILVEYAALEPDAVHAMSLDSPQLPGASPVDNAARSLGRAVHALALACAGPRQCGRPGRDIGSDLLRAARRLEDRPVRVEAAGGPVVVGGAGLVRVVRDRLASEPLSAGMLVPRLVSTALRGDVRPVAKALSARPGTCLGYLPLCDAPVSLGAYLSGVCPASTDQVASGPAYPGLGADDPYRHACTVWDSPPQTPSPPADVPTLVLWGDLDPFAPTGLVARARLAAADPYVVLVPGVAHDTVSALDCLRAVRNAWVLRPDGPPSYLDCLRSLSPSPDGRASRGNRRYD
jgi:pimeloyl-ACP methyl ester carboxylesterase